MADIRRDALDGRDAGEKMTTNKSEEFEGLKFQFTVQCMFLFRELVNEAFI